MQKQKFVEEKIFLKLKSLNILSPEYVKKSKSINVEINLVFQLNAKKFVNKAFSKLKLLDIFAKTRICEKNKKGKKD